MVNLRTLQHYLKRVSLSILRIAAKRSLPIKRKTLLHVRFETLYARAQSDVVYRPADDAHLSTLFLDRFIRKLFSGKGKIGQ